MKLTLQVNNAHGLEDYFFTFFPSKHDSDLIDLQLTIDNLIFGEIVEILKLSFDIFGGIFEDIFEPR